MRRGAVEIRGVRAHLLLLSRSVVAADAALILRCPRQAGQTQRRPFTHASTTQPLLVRVVFLGAVRDVRRVGSWGSSSVARNDRHGFRGLWRALASVSSRRGSDAGGAGG